MDSLNLIWTYTTAPAKGAGAGLRLYGQGAAGACTQLHFKVFAQVDFSHFRVGNNGIGFAVSEHLACADNVGAIANAEGFAYVVVGNQDADVAAFEKANDALD